VHVPPLGAAPAGLGGLAGADSFTVPELRDLQIWFNLAWFEPQALTQDPLAGLAARGRDFTEEDKAALAAAQADILARTLPAYREAAARGQIELSTSPYFHPILPLLVNTDSARVAVGAARLPLARFAHPEDAAAQVRMAMDAHETMFGTPPRGMWCSEQAVGEDVIPLLTDAGLEWTISDEIVLARSLSGTVRPEAAADDPLAAYFPYLLEREGRRLAIVFRDHTLSDLIGFAYQSWDSHQAARDLIGRLHEIRRKLEAANALGPHQAADGCERPLVTIALDGENAWEYYPRDGRDFLEALYEGLSGDPLLRCVTISEHLAESPARRTLPWLHTGSWIGGDLSTWVGDQAHGIAWDLLHRARDLVAQHGAPGTSPKVDEAWHHIHIVEGSDWFWWFGDRHHTELDHVWDLGFRRHLRDACRAVDETPPTELFYPLLAEAPSPASTMPSRPISPVIDGRRGWGGEGAPDEWTGAGSLVPDVPSTMQRAEGTKIREVRYGWCDSDLCLLVVPSSPSVLPGLEAEVRLTRAGDRDDIIIVLTLQPEGSVIATCTKGCEMMRSEAIIAAWDEVLEISVPISERLRSASTGALVLHLGRDGMVEHTFHTTALQVHGEGDSDD
jgi:hypothetical protein